MPASGSIVPHQVGKTKTRWLTQRIRRCVASRSGSSGWASIVEAVEGRLSGADATGSRVLGEFGLHQCPSPGCDGLPHPAAVLASYLAEMAPKPHYRRWEVLLRGERIGVVFAATEQAACARAAERFKVEDGDRRDLEVRRVPDARGPAQSISG
jgi:hypothetical protein